MRGKIQLKHGEDYYLKVLLKETRLEEIMTRPCISLKVNENFRTVPQKFKEFNIRHLPVVDEDHKLVGLITQRDLYKIQPPRRLIDGEWHYDDEMLDSFVLEHVMRKDPFSMNTKESIGEALLQMVHNKYGCIPIVDDNKILIGIITQIDILKVAAQIFEE